MEQQISLAFSAFRPSSGSSTARCAEFDEQCYCASINGAPRAMRFPTRDIDSISITGAGLLTLVSIEAQLKSEL